jgi:hypothetical protein
MGFECSPHTWLSASGTRDVPFTIQETYMKCSMSTEEGWVPGNGSAIPVVTEAITGRPTDFRVSMNMENAFVAIQRQVEFFLFFLFGPFVTQLWSKLYSTVLEIATANPLQGSRRRRGTALRRLPVVGMSLRSTL